MKSLPPHPRSADAGTSPVIYPYGTQYHRAPTPLPEEWEGDLAELARAGYSHIQLRPQWRWHERIRGNPTWDDLDELFALAEKFKLRVILKPMLETAPDWVFTELEGTRIGFHGVPIDPIAHGAYYVGGWWPCFDNPGVVAAAAEFVKKLTERYAQHPALWIYNAWNEPVSRPLGQCQCCHSTKVYREWLQERFPTIEKLNAFYGKAWTSYETLLPPSSNADYAEMFLWKQWAAASVAGQVRFVAEAIRSVDPKAFIMTHCGGSNIRQDPVWAASDDLLNAVEVDRYGTSFWVSPLPKRPSEWAGPDFQLDWMRRVDPDFWVAEVYPNYAEWCAPPTPRNFARRLWTILAGGAQGLTFWQYRSERVGNESNGYGMREIDGSPTARSAVADQLADILRQHGGLLAETRRRRSGIAILYSRESDLLGRLQNFSTGPWDVSQEQGNGSYAYKQAIKAAHTLYLMAGESVDWVVPGADLSEVSLLHVTAAEMIDARTAEWLREYVRQGGRLIVEYPFACRDENTWVSGTRPGHGLEDLLGCREGDRITIDAKHPETVTFPDGQSFAANGWRTELKVSGGTPFAHWSDGSVAGISHAFGKGSVHTLGASLTLSFADAWDDPIFPLFLNVLGKAGRSIPNPGEKKPWIRVRHGARQEIHFIFNPWNEALTHRLPSTPREIWFSDGASVKGDTLQLEEGAIFVALFS